MRLVSFTPLADRVVSACLPNAASLFSNASLASSDPLVVVAPEAPVWKGRAPGTDRMTWGAIHHAWAIIQQPGSGSAMSAWRTIHQYGQEVLAGIRFFRLRRGETRRYFLLLPHEPFNQSVRRFRSLLFSIGVWQHLMRGSGLFHAAGLERDGQAYLFAGPSGAGKSTVSAMSVDRGCRVIHEDHVLVNPGNSDVSTVADVVRPDRVTPLRAICFLFQDTRERLHPLSLVATAKRLYDSLLDTPDGCLLSASTLQSAFAVAAAVARGVPGYELHFRRSPSFWDVIDAELGA